MAFSQMGNFTFNHSDQPDKLTDDPAITKANFDSRGNELKTFINNLIDALNSTADGSSGADNLGMTPIDGLAGSSPQAIIESLKSYVDTNKVKNSGVPEILADLEANLPAAGTASRLFVATDTLKLFKDNGTAWDLVATNPGNIGATDLGFDPATQAELDAYIESLKSYVDTDKVKNSGNTPEILANTEANIPVAATVGRLFIATDTLKLFRDNGTAWNLVATNPGNIGAADLGFDPATQAELNTHLADYTKYVAQPIYNVKGYGAVGDGVTDDAAAIQAAIDAASAAGGGIVFLPQGTYKITSSLTMKSGVSIIGVGGVNESVILNSSNGTALNFPNTVIYTAVRLENFSIKGDTDGGYSPTYAIYGANFRTHCVIKNVRIWRHQYGIELNDCWYSLYENIYTNTTSTAIKLITANGVTIRGCIIHGLTDNTASALEIAGSSVLIQANYFESMTCKSAIGVTYSYGAMIISNYFENITGYGILIGSYTKDTVLIGNYLFGSNTMTRGIYFYGSDNYGGSVIGNHILNTTDKDIIASGVTSVTKIILLNNLCEGAGVSVHDIYLGFIEGRIVPQASTTLNRPADPNVGEMYFDTTLGKPIWHNGTDWIDATGTVV